MACVSRRQADAPSRRPIMSSFFRPALLAAALALATAAAALGRAPPPGSAMDADAPGVDALGDPLPAGAVARLGTTRLRHRGYVVALAFSPDGKRLASGGYDSAAHVWDTATGRRLLTLAHP